MVHPRRSPGSNAPRGSPGTGARPCRPPSTSRGRRRSGLTGLSTSPTRSTTASAGSIPAGAVHDPGRDGPGRLLRRRRPGQRRHPPLAPRRGRRPRRRRPLHRRLGQPPDPPGRPGLRHHHHRGRQRHPRLRRRRRAGARRLSSRTRRRVYAAPSGDALHRRLRQRAHPAGRPLRHDPTIAGTGRRRATPGDGGPAIAAQFDGPRGLAGDGAGNLYVADDNNHRIRRIDTAGVVTTLAGTGVAGFSGDGGPARSAQLDHPRGVAVDRQGNVFVADSMNARIRMVDPAGVIAHRRRLRPAGLRRRRGPGHRRPDVRAPGRGRRRRRPSLRGRHLQRPGPPGRRPPPGLPVLQLPLVLVGADSTSPSSQSTSGSLAPALRMRIAFSMARRAWCQPALLGQELGGVDRVAQAVVGEVPQLFLDGLEPFDDHLVAGHGQTVRDRSREITPPGSVAGRS